MSAVLEISGLQKTYRSRKGVRRALDGFDMVVEAGQVHGFLGPNGSGKTTTLRTLLGLIRPNGGRMEILGQAVPESLPEVAGQVGAIVESPQFFGNFTAETTLSLLADAGRVDQSRVVAVLELVGLRERAKDRVKTYSLGMKQRLAVASALLKNPKLLILDEPANGLDPGGIREMRTLMRTLSESGMTVLLSSHILGEIQLICDSVTIISAGKRVAAGPVADVLAQHTSSAVRVRVEAGVDLLTAAEVLRVAGAQVTLEQDHLLVANAPNPAVVTRVLAERQIFVSELAPVGVDLESVFLELTGTAPVEGQNRQVDQSAVVTAPSGLGTVSLYHAETRRLVKRRFTKILLIGALVVLGAVAVGMFVVNQKVGPAQIASAEKKADAEFQQQTRIAGEQKTQCQAAKGTPDAGNWPANCDDITPPTRDNFQTQWYLPATFNLREDFGAMVITLAGVLALAAFVVGASFVGAEWNSGGMMNLLLWRPQRLKVLSTKLSALLIGITVFAVLTAAAWTGIFALIAKYRGTTAKMTVGVWQSFGLMEVRALVLILVAAAVGFGLASIGRHTAVAFGVAIGVAVLLQIGLVTVLELAKVKFAELYLVPIWLQAWLQQSVKLEDYNSCNFSINNSCEPDSMTLTWHHAGIAMAIILVVVVGGAMWTIRRRDIT